MDDFIDVPCSSFQNAGNHVSSDNLEELSHFNANFQTIDQRNQSKLHSSIAKYMPSSILTETKSSLESNILKLGLSLKENTQRAAQIVTQDTN
ncbi:MAG: hypothetical protein MHPSP_003539, partial [Paramarteilia canceri]